MTHQYLYHRHHVVIVSGSVDHVRQTALVREPGQPDEHRVSLADLVVRDIVG